MTPIDYHDPNDFWRSRQPLGPSDDLFMKYIFILIVYVLILSAAGVLFWFIS